MVLSDFRRWIVALLREGSHAGHQGRFRRDQHRHQRRPATGTVRHQPRGRQGLQQRRAVEVPGRGRRIRRRRHALLRLSDRRPDEEPLRRPGPVRHRFHHRRHQQPVPRPGRARDDQRAAGHPRPDVRRRARQRDHHGDRGQGQDAVRDGVRLHRHDDRRGRRPGRGAPDARLRAALLRVLGHCDDDRPQHLPVREKGRRRGHPAAARHRARRAR